MQVPTNPPQEIPSAEWCEEDSALGDFFSRSGLVCSKGIEHGEPLHYA